MADDSLEQPVPAVGAAHRLLLATPGAGEHLARLLDLGAPRLVTRGAEVLAAARAGEAGAAVVGEALEEMSALELARALRAGYAGADLPLIIVADCFTDPAEEQALEAGADEFVDPAQVGARLVRRLRARLRLAWRRQESNPLTGLPGAGALGREVAARLPQRGRLAVVALDLRHFKAFNDCYGYARGDELLRLLRDTLLAVLQERGAADDFAAHLGGDDFFLVTEPDRLEPLVTALQERFDQSAPVLYDIRDREAGGVTVFTRTGEKRLIPLTRLLAVAVTNEAPDLRHPGQISALLAELKEYARGTENSGLICDRR
jgi:diguanylate cyclase (GGDEF)-like protein